MVEIICPVCNRTLWDGETCIRCSYHHSCDYEQYPTLCLIPAHTPSQAGLRAKWEQKQARIKAEEEEKMLSEQLKRELVQEQEKRTAIEAELKGELKALQDRVSSLESQIAELQKERSQDLSAKLKQSEPSAVKLSLSEQKAAYQTAEAAYEKGDYGEAVKWYRKAAEQGNTAAQCCLGTCYEQGKGVPKNKAEAVNWYRKAAEQGNPTAQYWLGICYELGRGVPENEAEAVNWYRKAAERGNPTAQYMLGFCYEQGKGVRSNYGEAVKWYKKVAEQGDTSAQRALARRILLRARGRCTE